MVSLAQSAQQPLPPWSWFWGFLKEELSPYPGRAQIVGRTVLAATLVMLVCMTFRLPYAFQGAVYALFITRESPRATLQSAGTILLVTALGAVYVIGSAYFVISVPVLHFLWNIGSFFLAFYAVSVIANYGAAVTFIIVISIAVPAWDQHVSAETSVENTLRLVLAAIVGVGITLAVELAFRRSRPGDDIVLPIAERLDAVDRLLAGYAEGHPPDPTLKKTMIRLGTVGTSGLRRFLRRSEYSPDYRTRMSGVLSLVGRLVDTAAALTELSVAPSAAGQARLRALAAAVENIRATLLARRVPESIHFHAGDPDAAVPLLLEMEATVSLIPQAFSETADGLPSSGYNSPASKLLVPDAFTNSEHFKFALRGCLAASLCYMAYNLIDWPGISTAVATCLLTALSTIGSSRQKQVLRLGGALTGGVVIGMGAQIFLLPFIDTIVGFTLLFVAVTAIGSWIMTSSARLSYFGLQIAFAFYLINLQEFAFQTSLSIARDRVAGIVLGLSAMWLFFDGLSGATADADMRRAFISNLRLLAQFAREPLSRDIAVASERSYSLRETINDSLDRARALADGVLFTFGQSRQQNLVLRARIMHLLPRLRLIFITRIALWKYRAKIQGFGLPAPLAAAQEEFDASLAKTLDGIADRMEGGTRVGADDLAHSADRLYEAIQGYCSQGSQQPFGMQVAALDSLSRRIQSLTISLDQEI